ncbi:sorbitol/mannitol transport system permease protein [Herbaspirillum sp. 1173]|uniref:carbohydrate ABC transporter permease n=1 Tax=Herbaspirillum sp. 1173 TaxID=2817734 RepID=UPI002863EFB8|nr:carbohydrate ABC transporter permease [Herbaspirillum sp. 1173]MDR6743318.1 sorbitol/mannitol transport system permease protein [Herbaspirillum sp. 1173]
MTRFLSKVLLTAGGWLFGLIVFFPILWMGLTAMKTEAQAVTTPPLLFFQPDWTNLWTMLTSAEYLHSAMNSVIVALGSTAICLILAIPGAYSMAFYPGKRTKDILLWMLSTKMMPAVAVLVPIYLIVRNLGLLDTIAALLLVHVMANLPIAVWMLFTSFKEIPRDIIEAARMDGATPLQQMTVVLLPLAGPGIASTALLSIILSWNETFWSINLTSTDASPLAAFIAAFSSPQGLFWARLSSASLLAIAPILVLGWLTQRRLVPGLTFGAVK